jgi:hypothetical protein
MLIWTAASRAGCDGWQSRSIFEPPPTPAWRDCRIQTCYKLLRNRANSGQSGSAHDPTHFALFLSGARSPGVILLRGATPIATAIEELALIWDASDAGEWIDRLYGFHCNDIPGKSRRRPRPNIFLRSTSPSKGLANVIFADDFEEQIAMPKAAILAPFSCKIMRD